MANSYAYCSVSISPVRAEFSDSSEMVTQLIFGEIIEVLEVNNQWRKVKSTVDGYEGWTDEKCISSFTETEMLDWKEQQTTLFSTTTKLQSDEGELLITRGSFIPESNGIFSIGSDRYSLSESFVEAPIQINQLALSYKNAPYLWGGKTLFGIDCSGFTQMVLRFFKINIPRDASQQAKEGKLIEFSDCCEGDLAFFENSNGKIHHVGFVLNDQKIIHAHGWVRIDTLDVTGIKNRINDQYSHKLAFIKRFT